MSPYEFRGDDNNYKVLSLFHLFLTGISGEVA